MSSGRARRLVVLGQRLCVATAVLGALGCGRSGGQGAGPKLAYSLERTATSLKYNALQMDFPAGYLFTLGGERFTATVPFGQMAAVERRVQFDYSDFGDYAVDLGVFLADGTPVLTDRLAWEADYQVPPDPVVGFSKDALSDANVALEVAGSRGPSTTMLWIAGDLAAGFHPEGAWYPITDAGRVPIRVSDGDGVKNLTVMYQNKYGVDSAKKDLQILRKSAPPTDCAAEAVATATADGTIRLRLVGRDSAPVAYRITGDLAAAEAAGTLHGPTVVEVSLTSGDGLKQVSVNLHDSAENSCLKKTFAITRAAGYQSMTVSLNSGLAWTDDPSATLRLTYDHFPEETVQMYVDGGVDDGPFVRTWIPFAEQVPLALTAVNGLRNVEVQFRSAGAATPTARATTGIYLKPFALLEGAAVPYSLLLSAIPGLAGVAVSGCAEGYAQTAFRAGLACTPTGSSVSVAYKLADGSQLVRTVAAP